MFRFNIEWYEIKRTHKNLNKPKTVATCSKAATHKSQQIQILTPGSVITFFFSLTHGVKITSDQFCINRHCLIHEKHLQLSVLSHLLRFDNNVKEQMFRKGSGKEQKAN